jgi:hypothetical protein
MSVCRRILSKVSSSKRSAAVFQPLVVRTMFLYVSLLDSKEVLAALWLFDLHHSEIGVLHCPQR